MNKIVAVLLQLSGEIKELKSVIAAFKKTRAERFKENWIDGQDVMLALNISGRTLSSWRNAGIVPYSKINNKIYYKVSDLENLLERNYDTQNKGGRHGTK